MSHETRLKLGIPQSVDISEDLLARLAAVRPTSGGGKPSWITPEKDNIIYYSYKIANKEDLAEALGVCTDTLRKRYRQLVAERGVPPGETDNKSDG